MHPGTSEQLAQVFKMRCLSGFMACRLLGIPHEKPFAVLCGLLHWTLLDLQSVGLAKVVYRGNGKWALRLDRDVFNRGLVEELWRQEFSHIVPRR